jgi:hypothetical protein
VPEKKETYTFYAEPGTEVGHAGGTFKFDAQGKFTTTRYDEYLVLSAMVERGHPVITDRASKKES